MKNAYMVECELLGAFSQEFRVLIPRQRYVINQMVQAGIIQNYSLSMDQAKLWIVFSAESEFEVMEELSCLPLINFMVPNISQLMFYNSSPTVDEVLQFSLN